MPAFAGGVTVNWFAPLVKFSDRNVWFASSVCVSDASGISDTVAMFAASFVAIVIGVV